MADQTIRARRRAVPHGVAEQLCARIADGELRPGDRLPGERELAQQMQVNRGSVREALKTLEQLRLIEIQPGSRTRILDPQQANFDFVRTQVCSGQKPRPAWVRDLVELREVLTAGLIDSVMERALGEQLDELVRSLYALSDAELAEPAFRQALWELPAYLARTSGNQVMLILANSVTRFLAEPGVRDAAERVVADERTALRTILVRLAVALEAREGDSAARAAHDLMRRLGDQLINALGAPG